MARSKRPPSDASPAPLTPTAKAGLLSDGLQVRLAGLALKLVARYEKLLDDPGYRPSPSDITGIFAAVRGAAELQNFLPTALGKVKALQGELAAMEKRLLEMLTSG